MIAKLKGKIDCIRERFAIIDVAGVGYRVFMTEVDLGQAAALENDPEIWIHTHIREDAFDLYGFLREEELRVFELLIGISGVGPKMALSILSVASFSVIKTAVASGDLSLLTKISGVGKKTAERIILELRSKIKTLPTESEQQVVSGIQEAIEALMGMGYSAFQAREALKKVPAEIEDLGEKIKLALKGMKK